MITIKIDRNIKIPDNSKRDIYPWDDLEIGDSFQVACELGQLQYNVPIPVYNALREYNKLTGKNIELYDCLDPLKILNTEGKNGIRFWRIK